MTYKKTILIDFDGVLNEYRGEFDENVLPDIKNGAKEFLKKLSNRFKLKLFTTRNRLLVSKWIIKNELDEVINDVTNVKEPCWLFIDDRCVKFDGDYDSMLLMIEKFKPWWK